MGLTHFFACHNIGMKSVDETHSCVRNANGRCGQIFGLLSIFVLDDVKGHLGV